MPALPLEALLRHQPEKRLLPCAVVSSDKLSDPSFTRLPPILAANRRAAARDVTPGLSVTRALARCPDLLLLPRDPSAEAHAIENLLECAESLAPDFEFTSPTTLTVDLGTIAHFDEALKLFRDKVPQLGLPAHLALARTPDLAHLLALTPSTSYCLHFRSSSYRWKNLSPSAPEDLAKLPLIHASQLVHLKFPAKDFQLLSQWGISSMAGLAALPRQALAERLGPPAAKLHDILHQKSPRLLELHKPTENFEASFSLEHPIDRCESLVFIAKRLLQTICARLSSGYHAASEIILQLDLDRGAAIHRRQIRLPEPSVAIDVIIQPISTYLEQLTLAAPVIQITIGLVPSTSHDGQHQLFNRGIRQPNRLADTLARLSALIGDDRVGFPMPAASHQPDAFDLHGSHSLFSQRTKELTAADAQTHLTRGGHSPLTRYRPPLEIAVASESANKHPTPLAILNGPTRGQISAFHGPFPSSGNWWDPADSWQRLEWDVQLESHHLLRLAFIPPDRWLLEGCYS